MEKVITLCRAGSCCPTVTISDDKVEIGEGKSYCTLTKEQWDILKEKILNQEI